MTIRYAAAACQTDFVEPTRSSADGANTDRMLAMIDAAVAGAAPFLPVRLVVFPEFAHAAPVFPTVRSWPRRSPCRFPTSTPTRLERKAREHDIYIQSGSMIESDPRWPGVVFNTTCLIGPEGILYKYRKVNPWIPYEVHASPHDLEGYDEPLFPVADTPIGTDRLRDLLRLAVSRGDPAACGERRRGAHPRVGLHGSVGRDRADELVDDRQPLPRPREHRLRRRGQPGREPEALPAVLVAWRQPGDRLRRPRCSQKRRRDQASGSSSRRSTCPRVRHERETRRGHHMLSHLRTEAYPVYSKPMYPAAGCTLSYEANNERIDRAKARFDEQLDARRFEQSRRRLRGGETMIRKLQSGEYRLYSRKKDPKTGRRRNLGTFKSRAAAEKHERAVQFFKRH